MLVDPVFQLDDVKVDQEADGEVQQAQGRQRCAWSTGMELECFFTVKLNHNAAVDHQIGAEPARFSYANFAVKCFSVCTEGTLPAKSADAYSPIAELAMYPTPNVTAVPTITHHVQGTCEPRHK
jgi:hypothetical protein